MWKGKLQVKFSKGNKLVLHLDGATENSLFGHMLDVLHKFDCEVIEECIERDWKDFVVTHKGQNRILGTLIMWKGKK